MGRQGIPSVIWLLVDRRTNEVLGPLQKCQGFLTLDGQYITKFDAAIRVATASESWKKPPNLKYHHDHKDKGIAVQLVLHKI